MKNALKIISIFSLVVISCSEHVDVSMHDKENDYKFLNDSLVVLNKYLFSHKETREVYYCSNSKDNLRPNYVALLDDQGEKVLEVDSYTFSDYGSFWLDSLWFYNIIDQYNDRKVTCISIDSLRGSIYFENARYTLSDGEMKYFGLTIQNDPTLNCEDIYLTNSESKFNVIDLNDGDQLEPYAVFNGQYLFHGCYLKDANMLSDELKHQLDKCVKEHKFVKRVEL